MGTFQMFCEVPGIKSDTEIVNSSFICDFPTWSRLLMLARVRQCSVFYYVSIECVSIGHRWSS